MNLRTKWKTILKLIGGINIFTGESFSEKEKDIMALMLENQQKFMQQHTPEEIDEMSKQYIKEQKEKFGFSPFEAILNRGQ